MVYPFLVIRRQLLSQVLSSKPDDHSGSSDIDLDLDLDLAVDLDNPVTSQAHTIII